MDPQYLQYLIPLGAFLVGAAVVYIVTKAHTARAAEEAARMETLLKNEINTLKDNLEAKVQAVSENILKGRCDELKEKNAELLGNRVQELQERNEALLKPFVDPIREGVGELQKRYDELQKKYGELQQSNKDLLDPLRQRMEEFRKAVESSEKTGIGLNQNLMGAITQMQKVTNQVSDSANNLAQALRGKVKTQGNWGEVTLRRVLEYSGLKKGFHFREQEFIPSLDGKRLYADVTVDWPDGKHLVIDSKVSLNSYTDYMNATDDTVRKVCLDNHCGSVWNHVNELIKKDYVGAKKKLGEDVFDYVIMFIPIEGAFDLAMKNSRIWDEAFKSKIIIASPVNLITLLQTINIAWQKFNQDKNQQEIIKTATQLLDRVNDFYLRLDDVGSLLTKTQETYNEAVKKLRGDGGAQSVVKSAKKLEALGIKSSKTLPANSRFKSDSDE
ncbi:MAG: DNA recombination protein RmuC [Verrucomicrobia bacterium]|nr:DNA recombination protein RmuC [Verrucomicrobiota bacterium]